MINDDANDWFLQQGQEIQDYEVPDAPDFEAPDFGIDDADTDDTDRPYGDVPEVTNDDVRNVMNMRAVSRPTAEVIVGTLDVVLPLLVTMLLRGTERDDCRLDPSEHETLVEAWATYLGDKNVDVSPGWALIISMITIYGAKVGGALANRKERQQLQAAQAEAERLRQELEEQRRIALALEMENSKLKVANSEE